MAVPSARSRKSSIRNTSSRSTVGGSFSSTIRGSARAGGPRPSRQQPQVAKKRSGMAQGGGKARYCAGSERGLAEQRIGRGNAVQPMPIDGDRPIQIVLEGHLDAAAAFEAERAAWTPPATRSASPPGRGGGRACQAWPATGPAHGPPWSRSVGNRRPSAAAPSPASNARRSIGNNPRLPSGRCGPFLRGDVQPPPSRGRRLSKTAIFLLRTNGRML